MITWVQSFVYVVNGHFHKAPDLFVPGCSFWPKGAPTSSLKTTRYAWKYILLYRNTWWKWTNSVMKHGKYIRDHISIWSMVFLKRKTHISPRPLSKFVTVCSGIQLWNRMYIIYMYSYYPMKRDSPSLFTSCSRLHHSLISLSFSVSHPVYHIYKWLINKNITRQTWPPLHLMMRMYI